MSPRKAILTGSVVLAAVALANPAFADEASRRKQIDEIQAREAAAIEQGRYKGDLTRREYRELLSEQAHVAALEKKAKEDGYVSRREYREIKDAQINAAKHIDSESSDGQVSFWRRWLYRHRY
jgi:hypothetical protein